jgi:hypothetical protein
MICRIQVVPLGEDSQQETLEDRIPAAHRFEAGDAGPDLGRGKMILKDLQQILVEGQVASFLLPKRPCPECGQPRYVKGHRSRAPERSFWS